MTIEIQISNASIATKTVINSEIVTINWIWIMIKISVSTEGICETWITQIILEIIMEIQNLIEIIITMEMVKIEIP